MSFGVSVGDVLAVGKGAPSEFEELSREVSTLHTAIKKLQDGVENDDSILNRAGNSERKELEVLVGRCRAVLQQLERLITRYGSLGTNQKRIQDRIKFDTKEVQKIREKLTSHTSAIQVFLTTLGIVSLGRIERNLEPMGRIEKKLETMGRIEKKLETMGRIEKKLETIMGLHEHVPAKQRSPSSTSSPKGQRTTAQRSKNPPLETKIDISGSDLKVNACSLDSRASTTSVHTATASGTKTTRTPTNVTPNKETDRFSRNDARKLHPPKSEVSSSSPHRTEGSTQKENKGLKTKDQSSRTTDPLSDPPKSKIGSSSPHRTECSAQKDNKGSKANGQSSRSVDPSNGPSESKTSSSPPHRTKGLTQKDNEVLKTKDQSSRTKDPLSDPPKSKTGSSSPHRTESSAQKDNKEFKVKGQSSRTVDPSNGPSELKTSSSSPHKTVSSVQKDNKVSKAKVQSSVIGNPSTEPRSPPRDAKIVERPLHLTLEELFTGTRKKVKISRELFDKSGKQVISDESVELKIKPGLRTGFKFEQEGVGEEGPQHIFFIVTEKPHDTFTRYKDNINSVVEIDPEEAFAGWSRTVFTIDGKYVPVSGAGPTPPDNQVTFPGLGMPKSRSPDERGDFIVTIKIKFPSWMSKDERKSIKQALRVDETQKAATHNKQTTSSNERYVH